MAHLKKLADKLKALPPVIKPILKFGEKNDEKLKTPCHTVSHLSRKVEKFIIPTLKMTAEKHRVASLAANQLGFSEAVFILHKDLIDNQWLHYDTAKYTAFINPELVNVGKKVVVDTEKCPSTAPVEAAVSRFDEIKVSFMDETGDYTEEHFSGFPARVIQHELDHLWGFTTLSYSVSFGELTFPTEEQNRQFQEIKKKFNMQTPQQVDTELGEKEYFVRSAVDNQVEEEFYYQLCKILS